MDTDTVVVPVLDEAMAGLNSPPDSNPALKDTGSDSELSDLEPDPADYDMLSADQPAPQTADSTAPESKDPYLLDIRPIRFEGGVPVFKPNMEEFSDFTRFVNSINHYGAKSGIGKVIPPLEWREAQPPLDDIVKSIYIRDPISQDFQKGATAGEYRQINMDHRKSYNLPQWRHFCDQRPAPKSRGQRNQPQEKSKSDTARKERNRGAKKTKSSGSSRSEVESPATPLTPMSPPAEFMENDAVDEEQFRPAGRMGGGRQPKSESEAVSVSARRKHGHRATGKIDEAAFVGFDYRFDCSEFTDERCEELEAQYWRSLMNAPPLYGADMMGSLFDDRTKIWNLGKLDNILDVLGETIPGVNTAYLYLGSWKATFAWHLEDVDLYSINYLHFGAPKQWYSIAQDDVPKFEAAMRKAFPESAKSCDQFLRHKTFLISPARLLASSGVKVNKIVHRPGEFIITFPYGYHSGYNLGYNCAEAVNFGTESWLEKGMNAKKCDCAEKQDPVWIDVRKIKKALGHEVEPSEYGYTDDEQEYESDDAPTDLPTPPGSSGDVKVKPVPKRKRTADDKADSGRRIRLKMSFKENPCVLCPNSHPLEPLLSTERGEKVHRLCAKYIPGPEIEPGENELVTGIKTIDKDRFTKLKCGYCKVNFGACFQCSSRKCTRAYHATCAAAAGVLVEEGWAPVWAEDGTEYKKWQIDLSCRFHRPKQSKTYDAREYSDERLAKVGESFKKGYDGRVNRDERLMKIAENLKKGDVCQVQYLDGPIWAGVVVENRKDESQTVLLDVLPQGGDMREVPFTWLLLPDPAKTRFQQASKNAKELPKSFGNSSSDSSNRQADDLPKADDPFVNGYTWAEFQRQNIPRNRDQVKIDFSKKDRVWYYLGKTSTEAKAQFTEDPAKPRHNPAGHFLDTVDRPVAATSRPSYSATYPSAIGPSALRHSTPATAPSRLSLSSAVATKGEKPYDYKPRPDKINYNFSLQDTALQRPNVPFLYGTDPQFRSGLRPNNSNWEQPHPNLGLLPRNPFTANSHVSMGSLFQGLDAGWIPPSARAESKDMISRIPDAQALSQLLSNKDLEYRLTANKPPEDIETQFGLQGSSKLNHTAPNGRPNSQGSNRTKSLSGLPPDTLPSSRGSAEAQSINVNRPAPNFRPTSHGSSGSKSKKSKKLPQPSPSHKPIPTEDQATPSAAFPSAKSGCRKCHKGADPCPPHKRFCRKHGSCQELDRWREDGGPGHDLCDFCVLKDNPEYKATLPAAQAKRLAVTKAGHSQTGPSYPQTDISHSRLDQSQPSNGFSQPDRRPSHSTDVSSSHSQIGNIYSQLPPGPRHHGSAHFEMGMNSFQPSLNQFANDPGHTQMSNALCRPDTNHSKNGSGHSQLGTEFSQPSQGFHDRRPHSPQFSYNFPGHNPSGTSSSYSIYSTPKDSQSTQSYHSHSIPTTSLTQYSSSMTPSTMEGKSSKGKYNPNSGFGTLNKTNPFGTKYTYQIPTKPTNLGFTQSWKYKYLQLEHNKGSSDYKSPYRPGPEFGFMNGYQGSVLSGAILKELSKFLSPSQLEDAKRMSQSKAHELLISLPQSQLPQSLTSTVHPAIRQQYGDLIQPRSWSSPRQSNSSVLEPPSLSGSLYKVPQQDHQASAPQLTRPIASCSSPQLDSLKDTTKASQQSTFQASQSESTQVSKDTDKSPEVTYSSAVTSLSIQNRSAMPNSGNLLSSDLSPNANHEYFPQIQVSQDQYQQPRQAQKTGISQLYEKPDGHNFQESPISDMQPCTSSLIEGILGKLKKVH